MSLGGVEDSEVNVHSAKLPLFFVPAQTTDSYMFGNAEIEVAKRNKKLRISKV